MTALVASTSGMWVLGAALIASAVTTLLFVAGAERARRALPPDALRPPPAEADDA